MCDNAAEPGQAHIDVLIPMRVTTVALAAAQTHSLPWSDPVLMKDWRFPTWHACQMKARNTRRTRSSTSGRFSTTLVESSLPNFSDSTNEKKRGEKQSTDILVTSKMPYFPIASPHEIISPASRRLAA